jgi:alkylation response protein AidB-like acyl-CoA dehydrogenase
VNFDLTEEQDLLQETVRQQIDAECPPTRVREIFDGGTGFDESLWKSQIEIGLGAIAVPEEFGGAGLELLELALVAEVLGSRAAPGPFLGHSLAGLAILLGGSDDQKQTWLPKLAMGEAIGTVAFGESGSLWQPEEWTAKANGSVSGTKIHVPFASLADLIVVGVAGGGLALVEKGAAGVQIEPAQGADRSRPIERVAFEGSPCEVLPEAPAGSGRLRDAGLVLLAADAFGGASRCVEMAVDYARTREQFGVTIGHFQALKHQLANMALETEPCRGLYWYAAHAFDHMPEESARAAAVAKAHVTDRYMQVARDTVEAHGGIGFTWECDVQLFFKRAMFDRVFLGSPAVHRERSAALGGWTG